MTDKELRKLSRSELIDIIYELRLAADKMQRELAQRAVVMEQSGSIAEAALGLNKVFEAAQAAADQYLLSVKTASGWDPSLIQKWEQLRRNVEKAVPDPDQAHALVEEIMALETRYEI